MPKWMRQEKINSFIIIPLYDDEEKAYGVIFAGNTTETPIQLKNSMEASLRGMKRQLIRAHVGHSAPPAFLDGEKTQRMDLGAFTQLVRKAMVKQRQKARESKTDTSISF